MYYLGCFKQAETAAKCESVLQHIIDLEAKLPAEGRKNVMDSRQAATKLDDEEALPILEKLLSEMETGKLKTEPCSQ